MLLAALLLCTSAALGGAPTSPDAPAWVEETLRSLTLEQKIGQMILPRLSGGFHGAEDPEIVALERLAREGKIGGAVLFAGDPYSSRRLIERLEAASAVPPLIASDYEWGAAMRVDGATALPRPMALGAAAAGAGGEVRAMELVRAHARTTAREARALGVGMVLAPVLDLAVEPDSRIVGTRSFGAEAERVGALGAEWIRALQAEGLIAVAKHFPGHGGTHEDSHDTLPTVTASRAELETGALAPFRAAIDAGAGGVMPGHLAVPALDPEPDRPASRSPVILSWLREHGFDGLVVSDALDMAGARVELWDGAVAAEAVGAGVDLILLPPDPAVAHAALLRAVRRGDLSEERIDESVRRILVAKARLRPVAAAMGRDPEGALERQIARPEGRAVAARIASAAITLVQDPDHLLPLPPRPAPGVLLVDVIRRFDRRTEIDGLGDELRRRLRPVREVVVTLESAGEELARIAPEGGELVVLADYGHHTQGDRAGIRQWLAELERSVPVCVVALVDPWVAAAAPARAAALVTYDASLASQRAVAQALVGEIAVRGRLPIVLDEHRPIGAGLERSRRAGALDRELLRTGVRDSAYALESVRAVIEDGLADEAFPGAVVVVGHRGRVILAEAFGRLGYAPEYGPTRLDTLWDLASLTKVVATTTLTMQAVDEGRLELEAPVARYLPEFSGGGREQVGKEQVEVADLLAHSSGVLWWTDLWARYGDLPPPEAKRRYLEEIYQLPLANPPRTKMVYSDLGLMLLGEILERVFGAPLGELAAARIFGPLGMTETRFRPSPELRQRAAPTELDSVWRQRIVRGEVHDENAFGLGGVAPHAGLFSTGGDLAVFAQMLLQGGAYDGRRLINAATVERFTHRSERIPGSSRALGWDTPSEPSSAGTLYSAESFGHTGFTGTSIWIDPTRELFAILLTNRVHPTRENRKLIALRPRFHDAVVRAVDSPARPRGDG